MVPADSRMLGRYPALPLYDSDPLPSSCLGLDWKSEKPKALLASVAIGAAIGAATHYHLECPRLLPTSGRY